MFLIGACLYVMSDRWDSGPFIAFRPLADTSWSSQMPASPAVIKGAFRALRPDACADIWIVNVETGEDCLLHRAAHMIEAPNWSPDGTMLYLNGSGRIAVLSLADSTNLVWLETDCQAINNDHVIAPDGRTLFVTADGGVFALPPTGGASRRLTPEGDRRYYLHGVSPDGDLLACTIIDPDDALAGRAIELVPADGGEGVVVISGCAPIDGPEWTPDGAWLWFNGEIVADAPGHSCLFRVHPDGQGLEQMTTTTAVDWFPHPSPDGKRVSFLRYPPGTEGHPADLPVQIMLMEIGTRSERSIATLTGGQGSINVNSWSPDGRWLAYVAYPNKQSM